MKLTIALAACLFSVSAFASTANDAAISQELEAINKLDCSVDHDQCRYYAALEYLAYAEALPIAYEKKFGEALTKDDMKEIADAVKGWTAIHDSTLNAKVMDKRNPFRQYLVQSTVDSLVKVSANNFGIYVARLVYIKANYAPENMTDILKGTKNYQAWSEQQQRLAENS